MNDISRPVLTLKRKPQTKAAEQEKSKDSAIPPVFRRKQRIDVVPRPKKK
ncbi:hypothetical protein WKC52_19880 [Morganella morganii]